MRHLKEHGIAEGRKTSQYYDPSVYRQYGDLEAAFFSTGESANNYYKLARHYLTNGIREERIANSDRLLPSGMGTGNTSTSTTQPSQNSKAGELLEFAKT